jgi:hypothetical protein
VEIDGLVEHGKAVVEEPGEGDGMCLGVRCGEAAALVAGACNGTAEDGTSSVVEICRGQNLLDGFQVLCRDVGNEKVLPDGEANLAGAEAVCDVGDGVHLRNGQAADQNGDSDVVEARLRLGVDTDMSGTINGAARIPMQRPG